VGAVEGELAGIKVESGVWTRGGVLAAEEVEGAAAGRRSYESAAGELNRTAAGEAAGGPRRCF
jgi:hypothetical protein